MTGPCASCWRVAGVSQNVKEKKTKKGQEEKCEWLQLSQPNREVIVDRDFGFCVRRLREDFGEAREGD